MLQVRSQIGGCILLVDVTERVVPVQVVRVFGAGGATSATTIATAAGCVVAVVVEVVHVAIVSLDLIVDVVVGTTVRTECAGIFVALATVARQEVLSRVASEVVPVVVGTNPRQNLIVQRLSLLLLLGVAVQIAAIVQIVQACCRLRRRWWRGHPSRRRSIGQIVDHIRWAETATAADGNIVERLLLLEIRIVVATASAVLVHEVVRMQRHVMVVQLVVKLLLLVDGIVSSVNVNMSEIAIATVATAAAGGSGVSVRI